MAMKNLERYRQNGRQPFYSQSTCPLLKDCRPASCRPASCRRASPRHSPPHQQPSHLRHSDSRRTCRRRRFRFNKLTFDVENFILGFILSFGVILTFTDGRVQAQSSSIVRVEGTQFSISCPGSEFDPKFSKIVEGEKEQVFFYGILRRYGTPEDWKAIKAEANVVERMKNSSYKTTETFLYNSTVATGYAATGGINSETKTDRAISPTKGFVNIEELEKDDHGNTEIDVDDDGSPVNGSESDGWSDGWGDDDIWDWGDDDVTDDAVEDDAVEDDAVEEDAVEEDAVGEGLGSIVFGISDAMDSFSSLFGGVDDEKVTDDADADDDDEERGSGETHSTTTAEPSVWSFWSRKKRRSLSDELARRSQTKKRRSVPEEILETFVYSVEEVKREDAGKYACDYPTGDQYQVVVLENELKCANYARIKGSPLTASCRLFVSGNTTAFSLRDHFLFWNKNGERILNGNGVEIRSAFDGFALESNLVYNFTGNNNNYNNESMLNDDEDAEFTCHFTTLGDSSSANASEITAPLPCRLPPTQWGQLPKLKNLSVQNDQKRLLEEGEEIRVECLTAFRGTPLFGNFYVREINSNTIVESYDRADDDDDFGEAMPSLRGAFVGKSGVSRISFECVIENSVGRDTLTTESMDVIWRPREPLKIVDTKSHDDDYVADSGIIDVIEGRSLALACGFYHLLRGFLQE